MSDDTQQESGSGLRAQLEQRIESEKAALTELEQARQELRTYRFRDAGLDPTSGMGKAIAKTYQGDDLSAEAILAFAKDEYGFEPGASQTTETQQVDEAQQAREQGQARLDAVDSSKLPSEAPSVEDQIRQAQADGDWTTSFNLKSQLLDEQRRERRANGAAI